MKNRLLTTTTKMIVVVALFVTIQSCKKDNNNTACQNPNFTATVDGNANFNACGAYAYEVLNNYSILATSDNDNITIGFLTPNQGIIVPGTYVVNGGASLPPGQAFIVDFVYKEDGTDLTHTYLSASGTLDLIEADSTHYKGTFNGTASQMGGGSATRTVSGSFDVLYQ